MLEETFRNTRKNLRRWFHEGRESGYREGFLLVQAIFFPETGKESGNFWKRNGLSNRFLEASDLGSCFWKQSDPSTPVDLQSDLWSQVEQESDLSNHAEQESDL